MNRRELFKGAFGLAVALLAPVSLLPETQKRPGLMKYTPDRTVHIPPSLHLEGWADRTSRRLQILVTVEEYKAFFRERFEHLRIRIYQSPYSHQTLFPCYDLQGNLLAKETLFVSLIPKEAEGKDFDGEALPMPGDLMHHPHGSKTIAVAVYPETSPEQLVGGIMRAAWWFIFDGPQPALFGGVAA